MAAARACSWRRASSGVCLREDRIRVQRVEDELGTGGGFGRRLMGFFLREGLGARMAQRLPIWV